jgi:hypothetical protein
LSVLPAFLENLEIMTEFTSLVKQLFNSAKHGEGIGVYFLSIELGRGGIRARLNPFRYRSNFYLKYLTSKSYISSVLS